MTEFAKEHVWKEDSQGVSRLVAAPGDPIPEDDAVGYIEAVDLEADTADAALAQGGEHRLAKAEKARLKAQAEVNKALAGPKSEKYAPRLPRVGEEGYNELLSGVGESDDDEEEAPARKSRGAEDKSRAAESKKEA